MRRDETEILTYFVNRIVRQMSSDSEKITRSSDGRSDSSHWGRTRHEGNRYREQGSGDRARTHTPNTCERNENSKREIIYRLCKQEGHWANTAVIVYLW